jgi:hypothetical protein
MAAEAGGGADCGRAGAGGGDTETLRAAEGPRPDRKREATGLPAFAAADDGSEDDDGNRLGWGARGDWERRWWARLEATADEESGGGACVHQRGQTK